MTVALAIRAAEALILLYLAHKARQAVEHLRVIRKQAGKPRSEYRLSPENLATFIQLTGREPE